MRSVAVDWEEVERKWRAIKKNCRDTVPLEVYVELSRALRLQGKLRSAKRTVKTGTRKYPRSSSIRIECALIASSCKEWSAATRAWGQIHRDYPDKRTPRLYIELSRGHRNVEQWFAAETWLNEGMRVHPRDDRLNGERDRLLVDVFTGLCRRLGVASEIGEEYKTQLFRIREKRSADEALKDLLSLVSILDRYPTVAEQVKWHFLQRSINLNNVLVDSLKCACNPKKTTVVILYHRDMWAQLGVRFLDEMSMRGYNCIPLSVSTSAPDESAPDEFIRVRKRTLIELDCIDVCISYNLSSALLNQCTSRDRMKVVDIDRTARYALGDEKLWPWLMNFGRYLVRPIRDSEWGSKNKVMTMPEALRLPSDRIRGERQTFVLPLMPNKYERIREERQDLNTRDINEILICPSKSDLREYFTTVYGKKLVESLLKTYPDHLVVFRPRAEDRQNEEVLAIRKMYEGHARFVFDDCDDYCWHYARGSVLITDVSSTGQTFTVATGRPSIFFPQKTGRMNITIPELRDVGCFKVGTFDELLERIGIALDGRDEGGEALANLVASICQNNHSFAEKFFVYLEDIVQGRINDDWYCVSLSEANITGKDACHYEESIESVFRVFDELNGFHIVLRFGLVERYLELKGQLQEPIPWDIVERLHGVFSKRFMVGHAQYNTVRKALGAVYHNWRLSVRSPRSSEIIKEWAELISLRGDDEMKKMFSDELRKVDPEFYSSIARNDLLERSSD